MKSTINFITTLFAILIMASCSTTEDVEPLQSKSSDDGQIQTTQLLGLDPVKNEVILNIHDSLQKYYDIFLYEADRLGVEIEEKSLSLDLGFVDHMNKHYELLEDTSIVIDEEWFGFHNEEYFRIEQLVFHHLGLVVLERDYNNTLDTDSIKVSYITNGIDTLGVDSIRLTIPVSIMSEDGWMPDVYEVRREEYLKELFEVE